MKKFKPNTFYPVYVKDKNGIIYEYSSIPVAKRKLKITVSLARTLRLRGVIYAADHFLSHDKDLLETFEPSSDDIARWGTLAITGGIFGDEWWYPESLQKLHTLIGRDWEFHDFISKLNDLGGEMDNGVTVRLSLMGEIYPYRPVPDPGKAIYVHDICTGVTRRYKNLRKVAMDINITMGTAVRRISKEDTSLVRPHHRLTRDGSIDLGNIPIKFKEVVKIAKVSVHKGEEVILEPQNWQMVIPQLGICNLGIVERMGRSNVEGFKMLYEAGYTLKFHIEDMILSSEFTDGQVVIQKPQM